MKLATFLIKTISGENQVEVKAFTACQAITIWKHSKPTDLFKSCILIKSSKERDRYYELKSLHELSEYQLNEIELIVENFRNERIFKEYKKFPSFKREPNTGE
jgi:hypothetical protein